MCGVGQNRVVDLLRGRAGGTGSAEGEQEVLRGNRRYLVGKEVQEAGIKGSTDFMHS